MSSHTPSRAIALYGTEEPTANLQMIHAGPLSVLFDGANLRDIRMHREEVIRAISFIVRDKEWATWIPTVSDLSIDQDKDAFDIRYQAEVGSGTERFVYDVRLNGNSHGVLSFSASGASPDGLQTNRTGFVVLHPIKGINGQPATTHHTDGTVVETTFPNTINPIQPMKDLREITHTTPGGQRVSCLMEGDTFEMEDQRQWTDASYKTYVRPLALPWPYRIEPGEKIEQKITISVTGAVPALSLAETVDVHIGETLATKVPPLGLGLQPEDAQATLNDSDRLQKLGAHHLICHYDPRRGHDIADLEKQIETARALNAQPWLEAVVEAADTEGALVEITNLGNALGELGQSFRTVLVSPAPDLKCTLPGSPWPPAPDAAKLYAATRTAFPKAQIGGGMFSFFTELNRKRPPTEALDIVSFTTAAIFHAGDDRSMMETLECLPHITRTVPEIVHTLPYAVGPSAIAMRDNPYGDAAIKNPQNIRQAVNFNDPRQRGVMGAAWTLGYFSAFAYGRASAIAIGAPVGAFGVLYSPTEFPQPWFEDHGGYYPVWHVMRGLSALAGNRLRMVTISAPEKLCGMAVETQAGIEVWLCNILPEEITVRLHGAVSAESFTLSAATFTAASTQPELADQMTPLKSSTIDLDAFSVTRIVISK